MSVPLRTPHAEPEESLVRLDALARHHGASRLPLATAMYLGANIARAVAAAHDRGEVIGKLDANRIRCSHSGQVVIVREGGSYMAPETKRGEPPDVLSDIYAMGAIVYRLLTGMTPLQAMTRQPVSRLHEVPAPSALIPGIDPSLDDVLLSALSTDPGERPISARVLSDTIDRIFEELELIASPSGVVRAVEATGSRRVRPPPARWDEDEKTPALPAKPPPAESPTQTNLAAPGAPQRELETQTTDLKSIIVSPSLYTQCPVETPTARTAGGTELAEPTREVSPPAPPQNPTVLERKSRVTESPTQSQAPQTSLIYGHPFFKRQESFVDEAEAAVDEEFGDDVMPFGEALSKLRHRLRFAGEVYRDATQRLSRRWRRAPATTRLWGAAAFVGAVVAGLLGVVLLSRASNDVEVVGEPEVAVSAPLAGMKRAAAAPAKAPAAPAEAPAEVRAKAPAEVQAKAPVAQEAPVEPTPAASKAKKSAKLSKKALAAKKKKAAAKRAAARRTRR